MPQGAYFSFACRYLEKTPKSRVLWSISLSSLAVLMSVALEEPLRKAKGFNIV